MNRRAPFRQVDVTRALRAAKKAGLTVSHFEIDSSGKIFVDSAVPSEITKGESAFDKWEREYGAANEERRRTLDKQNSR